MPIDTRQKRQNTKSVGRPAIRGRFATGTINLRERMNTGLTYGWDSLVVAEPIPSAEIVADLTITPTIVADFTRTIEIVADNSRQ